MIFLHRVLIKITIIILIFNNNINKKFKIKKIFMKKIFLKIVKTIFKKFYNNKNDLIF